MRPRSSTGHSRCWWRTWPRRSLRTRASRARPAPRAGDAPTRGGGQACRLAAGPRALRVRRDERPPVQRAPVPGVPSPRPVCPGRRGERRSHRPSLPEPQRLRGQAVLRQAQVCRRDRGGAGGDGIAGVASGPAWSTCSRTSRAPRPEQPLPSDPTWPGTLDGRAQQPGSGEASPLPAARRPAGRFKQVQGTFLAMARGWLEFQTLHVKTRPTSRRVARRTVRRGFDGGGAARFRMRLPGRRVALTRVS